MEVAYCTSKLFPNGEQELKVKFGHLITEKQIRRAQRSRRVNKERERNRRAKIIRELNALKFTAPDYIREKERLELDLRLRSIDNIRRSANRARQNLYDICKCNSFAYFVTFTYSPEELDRNDDELVKRKFTEWQNNIRKRYPDMYYVATPEYHERGALHFHLLVGGISAEALKLTPARYKNGRQIVKNGKQIYNANAWKWGYSTVSKIENLEASRHYICKYITKQNLDDRFFHKRRYYCSHNIIRPETEKYQQAINKVFKGVDLEVQLVKYFDAKKDYFILTNDGSGEIKPEDNTATVKKIFGEYVHGWEKRESASGSAARPRVATRARVPYLTIGTLNSKVQKQAKHRSETTPEELKELPKRKQKLELVTDQSIIDIFA